MAYKQELSQKAIFISQNFLFLVAKIYSISRGQNLELFTYQNEKTIFQKF